MVILLKLLFKEEDDIRLRSASATVGVQTRALNRGFIKKWVNWIESIASLDADNNYQP